MREIGCIRYVQHASARAIAGWALAAALLAFARASYLALVGVQANILRGEPDLLADLANNSLIVHVGLGGNLTKDHHHASLACRLAGHLRQAPFVSTG